MSTYNDASLIYYPSGYKAGTAYSLKPTDGSGDLTFTRASTATRVNESGLIESVATGVPRIDYTGGGCAKLLLEPQSTNIITESEPTNTVSFKTGVVFQTTSIYSWNGIYYGDNSVRRIAFFIPTTIVGIKYCFSFFVKMTDSSIPSVGATSSNDFQIYLSSYTIENLTITEIGGGIYRVSVTKTAGSTTSPLAVEKTTSMSAKTFEISGLQLEVSNVLPSSYIRTSGTAVTRVKDTSGTSGLSSLINSSEGTLYVEIRALADDQTERYIALNDGSNTNVVRIGYFVTNPNQILYQVNASGLQTNVLTTDYTITDFNKIAVTWKLNEFKIFINGSQVGATDTIGTPPIGLNTLAFGNVVGLNQTFSGENKGVMVFTTALTDTELATLTTL